MPEEPCPGTQERQLEINKAVVLDALKASCLIRSWARSGNVDSGLHDVAVTDAELGADLDSWKLVETLRQEKTGRYEEVRCPDDLLLISDALAVSLFVSSEKEEYFAIRRELNKIRLWLKEGFKIDPGESLPSSAARADGSISGYEELQTVVRYLPELKQGWSEARADGVQDYLTGLSLGLNEKRRGPA